MYKTLPNEDESQRKGRMQKEMREAKVSIPETAKYIKKEFIVSSIFIEDVKPTITEKIKIAFKQRGRPRKGN